MESERESLYMQNVNSRETAIPDFETKYTIWYPENISRVTRIDSTAIRLSAMIEE